MGLGDVIKTIFGLGDGVKQLWPLRHTIKISTFQMMVHDEVMLPANELADATNYLVDIAIDRLYCDGIEDEDIVRGFAHDYRIESRSLYVGSELVFRAQVIDTEFHRDPTSRENDGYFITIGGAFYGRFQHLNAQST